MSRDKWDTNITTSLLALWFERMPANDRVIAAAHRPGWLSKVSSKAVDALDEIIVRQASTLGWRIGLSGLVQWRLSEWETTIPGLRLLRRYHSGVEQAARIYQRREKPPLNDPDLYVLKVATVKELRVLLREMRDVFRGQLSHPPGDLEPKVVSHFLNASRGKRPFPTIAANRDRWKAFFEEQPTVLRQLLGERRLRPATLFNSWLAWCKGVSDEWLRQVLSKLASSPRKPI